MSVLVWLTRDLRVQDHPALAGALAADERVVPVFCLDDRLLHGRNSSIARVQFLLDCLQDLEGSLRERGGRLVIRHGRPEQALIELAREIKASEIHHTYDISPFARQRAAVVARAASQVGISIHEHPGLTLALDVRDIRSVKGEPYTVFSPFYRRWCAEDHGHPLAPPREVRLPAGIEIGRIPSLRSLGLREGPGEIARGGETQAHRQFEGFLSRSLQRYAECRDSLGEQCTSRLSPYLHFGCISPRWMHTRLGEDEQAQAFRRQLCWRDFYHHLLYHFPENAVQEFQSRYRGKLTFSADDQAFDAWTQGRTGFPLVDAGMRQLLREGWMPGRARLVVGSFLTKDLGIDWRRGERWFMRMLIDGDKANNNGNWQWIASVGIDPQPVFRRIYNPILQMERHDPDGLYVRTYVPELRSVPEEYLREPWRMPLDTQRQAECVIGVDYPAPIVDRREAREQALARYYKASSGS